MSKLMLGIVCLSIMLVMQIDSHIRICELEYYLTTIDSRE